MILYAYSMMQAIPHTAHTAHTAFTVRHAGPPRRTATVRVSRLLYTGHLG